MAQLTINKTWADGETPTKADLDNIVDGCETFLNVTGLSADNIQTNSIDASATFDAGTITSGKIANGAITTAKIADGAITVDKIMNGAITTAKITDTNITTAKIAASTIDPSKFGTNSITPSKLEDAIIAQGTNSTANASAGYGYLTENTSTTGIVSNIISIANGASYMESFDASYITDFYPLTRCDLYINGSITAYAQINFSDVLFDNTFDGALYTRQTYCYYPISAIRFISQSTYTAPSAKIGLYTTQGNMISAVVAGRNTVVEIQ